MKNPRLDNLKKMIVQTLTAAYGYCGLADADDFAMINSGGEGENFIVTIRDESNPKPTTGTAPQTKDSA